MELEGDNKEQRRSKTEDREATGQSNTEQEQQLSMPTPPNTAFHRNQSRNLCLFYTLYLKNSHIYKQMSMVDTDTAHKLFYSITM
jgi:hypothetical protein